MRRPGADGAQHPAVSVAPSCGRPGAVRGSGADRAGEVLLRAPRSPYRSGRGCEAEDGHPISDVRDHFAEIRDETGYTVPKDPGEETGRLFRTVKG